MIEKAEREVFGQYVVYELLGQGGMATVHRAEKRGVGIRRPVALKRLLSHVAADPDLVKLFVDEARLASKLHHANVAQTYELGRVAGVYFIAMEYASGPTLSQIVRQCQKLSTELPLSVTVNILAQVCDALDYAHNLCDEAGQPLRIIHRDVSPGNIMVTNTGVVKLIDFGIAKATTSSVKTQAGFIKGKFGYIAPEYITGQIDARVDLFATGVIAHELLAGRRLFEGKDDFETIANIREMALKPPSYWNPRVPPDIDDIVMTALARDPDKRWQSASALRVALTNVGRELGVAIGGPQLVEWVEWLFSQRPGTPCPQPDSSVSIEVAVAPPSEPSEPHQRLRAPSPSDLDATVPMDRFRIDFNDPRAPVPSRRSQRIDAVPRLSRQMEAAQPPRPSRQLGAVPPPRQSRQMEAAAPPTRPSRQIAAVPAPQQSRQMAAAPEPLPSQTIRAVPPPPRSRTIAAVPPPPQPSQTISAMPPPPPRDLGLDVPPAGLFDDEPRREPPSPPKIRPRGTKRTPSVLKPVTAGAMPAVSPVGSAAAAAKAPATAVRPRSRRWLWLILLMVVLGAGAAAAAYFWPIAL